MSEVQNSDASHEEAVKKAGLLGWVPLEEYKGDASKWRDAEEFLEFGEKLNPILRENNKRLESQLRERDKQIADIQKKVEQFAKLHAETAKAAYAEALADLKAQKKVALESGDYDAVVEVDEKIAATKEAEKTAAITEVPQSQRPTISPEVQATYDSWASENEWVKDEEMETYARAVGELLKKHGEPSVGADFRPFLDKVTAKVKSRFPEKFETEQVSRVESGGSSSVGGSSGKRSFNNLPKEAKESYEFLKSTGSTLTKEQYAAAYKW